MSSLIGVIGLVSGIFQNINTPTTWMAPKHDSSTIVRVYAGLSANDVDSTSGNIPGVAVWDGNGAFIGKAMGIYNYVINNGKFYDLTIKGKQASAEYLSVSAFGKDGLCVAAVSVTSPTGYQAGWFGDVGMMCGAPWYPSNLVIAGSDPEARPACIWIDQDGTNNHNHTGITMHMPSFTGAGLAQEYNDNIDTLCRSLPRFSVWKTRSVHMTLPVFYKDKMQFNEDGSDKDLDAVLNPSMMQSETTAPNDPTGTKLGVADGPSALLLGPVTPLQPSKRKARRSVVVQPMRDQLVVSNITSHSAHRLCESTTSSGPDFVSTHESLFCDMDTKQLWQLCSDNVAEDCFDLQARALRIKIMDDAASELRRRDAAAPEQLYRRVHEWS